MEMLFAFYVNEQKRYSRRREQNQGGVGEGVFTCTVSKFLASYVTVCFLSGKKKVMR